MQAVTTAEATAPHAALRSSEPARTPTWRASRAQAFAIHLTLSLLVFSSLVLVMLRWWFPGELFLVDGGWQGLKLVAMVDLVLGPALTLILYKPGKPKLVLDMVLIATIQLAALGYGFVTTWQQRTVAVVYAERAFNTVSAQAEAESAEDLRAREVEPRDIGELVASSDAAGARARVPLLMTPAPGKGEFGKYLADLFNGFPEMHERSDKYVVLAAGEPALADGALTLDELDSDAERAAVEAALGKIPLAADAIELHRFRARYASGIAIFDPAAARIVDYVPRPRSDGSTTLTGAAGATAGTDVDSAVKRSAQGDDASAPDAPAAAGPAARE